MAGKTEAIAERIETLAHTYQAGGFKLKRMPEPYQNLNGKLFLIPNEPFLQAVIQDSELANQILGFNLVSLFGDLSSPLPFDQDHPYVERWKENPFARNWHLWLQIGEKFFNNSLVRLTTFDAPKHLHVEEWTNRQIDEAYPYGWMNLMLNFLVVVDPDSFLAIEQVFNSWLNASLKELHDHQDEPITSDFWQEILAFSKEENRQATYDHLVLHDRILQGTPEEKPAKIKSSLFRVDFKKEEAAELEKSNCLNLYFFLHEDKFYAQLKIAGIDEEIIANLEKIRTTTVRQSHLLSDEKLDELIESRKSAYTSTEMMFNLLTSDTCPAVLLQGAKPKQQLEKFGIEQVALPGDVTGLSEIDSDLVSLINDPQYREPLTSSRLVKEI